MRKIKSYAPLALMLTTLCHCGGNNPAPPVDSMDNLSPAERSQHCFMRTTPETDSTVFDSLRKSLDGTWQHYPEAGAADAEDSHRTLNFEFFNGHDSVTQSEYHLIYNDIQNFKYKKVCVSAPMDQTAGVYADYRLMELMSAENEGAAAIAFKIDTSAPRTKLLVSDYYYVRYPDHTGPMPTFVKLQSAGSFTKIWSYGQ